MVNENYLFAAKNLADRNKNRLDKERDPIEKEKEGLFYWIMSRLEWCVEGCWPAKESHSVTVKEGFCYANSNRVLLEHGRVSEYLSKDVTREEFYSVMEQVAEIFNEIGEQVEGYHFNAKCFITAGNAELTVHMFTKK